MKRLNPLRIGLCNWGTAFTNPGRGCSKPKGHPDSHDVYGQSGIPSHLATREAQEAWAAEHAPAWGLDKGAFERRLQSRARTGNRS